MLYFKLKLNQNLIVGSHQDFSGNGKQKEVFTSLKVAGCSEYFLLNQ
jgi:hypothetical protein